MAPCRRPIDRRRAVPRRFEEIRRQLLRDLAPDGDVKNLSAADIGLIETAALLLMRSEMLRAEILNGNAVSDETLVRVSNGAARALNALRGKKRTKRVTTLEQYLADGDHDQKDEA